MPEEPRHYTAAEVAKVLRVGAYHAGAMCKAGKIPGAFKLGGRWLVDAETFDRWVEEAKKGAAA